MGGPNREETNTNQQQFQQGQSQTTPWAGSQALLSQILGGVQGVNANPNAAETGAINQLSALGTAGNPNTGNIQNLANTLISGQGAPDRTGMVNDAYSNYQKQLSPYLSQDFLDPYKTPGFPDALSTLNNDITGQVNSSFAAAGRDMSGLNQQTLARGLSQGEGGLIQNQYNQNVGVQRGAQDSLYGAGNTTGALLSSLDQTALGNRLTGLGVQDAATAAANQGPQQVLQAEALRRGIPLETLAAQMGLVLPASQAFGNTTNSSSGQTQGQSTRETQVSPVNTAIGAGISAAGLFGGSGLLSRIGGQAINPFNMNSRPVI